jgi:hypothetical protein
MVMRGEAQPFGLRLNVGVDVGLRFCQSPDHESPNHQMPGCLLDGCEILIVGVGYGGDGGGYAGGPAVAQEADT